MMVGRVMALFLLCHFRGVLAFLEQPASSLMQLHPRFQQSLGLMQLWVCKIWLGYFMAESAKPVLVYCNRPFVDEFRMHMCRTWLPESDDVVVQYQNLNGERKCMGSAGLKGTQEYPKPFGVAAARVYKAHKDELALQAASMIHFPNFDLDMNALWQPLDDAWIDADFQPVFDFL